MASHIQVVLREDIKNLGKTGELVRVRPGYARNFLLPRGLAAVATRGNIESIEHEKKAALARAAKLRATHEDHARALEGLTIQLGKQVGEENKLYGSVTSKEIAEGLRAKGFEIDRRNIQLEQPIRVAGEHSVAVKVGPQVTATIKVNVVKGEQ